MIEKKEKIAVAVSGGVDSGTALSILKEAGYDLIAVFTKHFHCIDSSSGSSCCSTDSLRRARTLAEYLDVPFYTLDFIKDFSSLVERPLLDYYNQAKTPNPCVLCNEKIRFGTLMDRLKKMGISYLATGHYARIQDSALYAGIDKEKDQSYFLYSIKKDLLNRIIFPLGNMYKKDVRSLARRKGLPVMDTEESQDCCIFMEKTLSSYLSGKLRTQSGDIIDEKGNVTGQHEGYQYYTIGQRRGLGGGHEERKYVTDIIASSNTVVIGGKDKLYKKRVRLKSCIFHVPVNEGDKYDVKLRYTTGSAPCCITEYYSEENSCIIELDKPERGPASGQYAVLYSGDMVIGGGEITT